MGQKIELDEDWLREKYVDEFLTAGEIAELTEASERTVRRRMKDYGIEVRTNGPKRKPLAEEFLQREYVEKGRSARDIADGKDYSRNHVQRSLEYHGMEIRSRKEAIWEKHGNKCAYRTHPRGHVVIGAGDDMLYVHQLLAIAEGADPHDVFGGDFHCHHKNEIPWDNRPDNLEVLAESEHHEHHYQNMEVDDSGRLVKKALR